MLKQNKPWWFKLGLGLLFFVMVLAFSLFFAQLWLALFGVFID